MKSLRFLSLSLVVLLGACATGSKPSRYYLLPSLEDAPAAGAPRLGDGPSLGVLDVDLPDYLDRPQLVVRHGEAGVELREFTRWAGSLKAGVQRVLMQDLALLLDSVRIYRRPWPRGVNPEWRLAVAIDRLDVDTDGVTRLYGAWRILDGEGRKLLAEGRERIVLPAVNGEAAWVRAQGEAVAELARRIARRVASL